MKLTPIQHALVQRCVGSGAPVLVPDKKRRGTSGVVGVVEKDTVVGRLQR